jgi:UDP-N-acetylglucosamine 2-epimerase (non-hydrolysing)
MDQSPHRLLLVAGARPNFMKLAPIVRALRQAGSKLEYRLVHTGQHYDRDMSRVFFEELDLPEPDFHLHAGSGTHAAQTAQIMTAFEPVCQAQKPSAVVVVGDVNSTLACSVVAKKLGVRVAHVEAGLRSGDMRMPEEINRIVTDSITDYFFVTERAAVDNLRAEGKAARQIFFVGHTMIDNLLFELARLERSDRSCLYSESLKVKLKDYAVLTLHRPSNVDDASTLQQVMQALARAAEILPIVFPVHPRTAGNLRSFGIAPAHGIHLTPPLSYLEFLNLWASAKLVLTDSGGIQEETTALGIPCLTLRENTERPITIEEGTNVLVGRDPERIVAEVTRIVRGTVKRGRRPELWDGHAAERIVSILERELSAS